MVFHFDRKSMLCRLNMLRFSVKDLFLVIWWCSTVMHQCRDALLWCIIPVMHYRYNASTLWCIENIMCQCYLLYIMFYWYDVLRCSVMSGWCMVWCVEMQCDEWVMHSMMQCVLNGWCVGDAWVVWCVMWMNERMNEWMFNKWACGQCRMIVWILLYFIYL